MWQAVFHYLAPEDLLNHAFLVCRAWMAVINTAMTWKGVHCSLPISKLHWFLGFCPVRCLQTLRHIYLQYPNRNTAQSFVEKKLDVPRLMTHCHSTLRSLVITGYSGSYPTYPRFQFPDHLPHLTTMKLQKLTVRLPSQHLWHLPPNLVEFNLWNCFLEHEHEHEHPHRLIIILPPSLRVLFLLPGGREALIADISQAHQLDDFIVSETVIASTSTSITPPPPVISSLGLRRVDLNGHLCHHSRLLEFQRDGPPAQFFCGSKIDLLRIRMDSQPDRWIPFLTAMLANKWPSLLRFSLVLPHSCFTLEEEQQDKAIPFPWSLLGEVIYRCMPNLFQLNLHKFRGIGPRHRATKHLEDIGTELLQWPKRPFVIGLQSISKNSDRLASKMFHGIVSKQSDDKKEGNETKAAITVARCPFRQYLRLPGGESPESLPFVAASVLLLPPLRPDLHVSFETTTATPTEMVATVKNQVMHVHSPVFQQLLAKGICILLSDDGPSFADRNVFHINGAKIDPAPTFCAKKYPNTFYLCHHS